MPPLKSLIIRKYNNLRHTNLAEAWQQTEIPVLGENLANHRKCTWIMANSSRASLHNFYGFYNNTNYTFLSFIN